MWCLQERGRRKGAGLLECRHECIGERCSFTGTERKLAREERLKDVHSAGGRQL